MKVLIPVDGSKAALSSLLHVGSLARSGVWQTVPPSTVVIREGDPGERFFVLESGSVDVSRGGEFVRTLSSPGDGFGEIALLRNVPRTATVTATSESQLLGIGRTEFLAAVTGQPVVSAAAGRIVDAYLDHDRAPAVDPEPTRLP